MVDGNSEDTIYFAKVHTFEAVNGEKIKTSGFVFGKFFQI